MIINQQRIQTYINIIQELLITPTEKTHQILAANQELLDAGLLQTIIMVAQTSAENGNQEANEFLLTLAVQLSEKLEVSITENISATAPPIEYLKFLIQILQATHESKNDPKIINSILEENLNKLDSSLAETLQAWGTSILVQVKPEAAHSIAADIINFSNRIQEFTLGNKADNLEIAITGYKTALTVYNSASKTHQWARVKNNLGTAYINRIYGEKSVNIEQGIEIYQQALKFIYHEESPLDWAMTQNNLGHAYIRRIEGNKAKNIEQAITSYQKALQVITKEKSPHKWATIKNNLANTYLTRITGKVSENIELAIAAYQQVLQVITQEENSLDWAMTQNNLGHAYMNRIKPKIEENIEQAISAYQGALKIISRANKPDHWANIQTNLGTAYLNRATGEVKKNVELAISAYQGALQIFTPVDNFLDWVITSINLGTSYLHQETVETSTGKNIERAISLYQNVLEVINRENFSLWWGITQGNLGEAYSRKFTTKNNANFDQNLELAIAAYQQALQILNSENHPLECLQISRKLGDLGFENKNWHLGIEGYKVAIKLLEATQSLAKTEPSYGKMLAESIYIYSNIVECYVNVGNYEQAWQYLEASRSRGLVDLMMINNIYQGVEKSPEVDEYYHLQKQINHLNFDASQINKPMMVGSQFGINEIESKSQEKIAVLREKKQHIWEKIRSSDRVLAEQLQVTHLSFTEMQQLIKDEETAVLDFYSTRNNTYIFIVTQQQITVHICWEEGFEKLQNWIHDNWLKNYRNNRNHWHNQMESFLSELAERLQLNQLIKQLTEIKELIIVPHVYLYQIPFAALPVVNEKETKYFSDYFRLRIVPSCQIISYCSEKSLVTNPRKMGIVETSIANLFYTRYECETLANMHLISPEQRLQYRQATVNNYQTFIHQVQMLHCSHFTTTNIVNPLESKINLFDGDISINTVFTWRLPELFDVFLSSCEMNLDQTEISDNIVTFASAFISAGVRHVISSLWLVEDLATALFCLFYYKNRQNYNRPQALYKAQHQLRNLTGTELTSYKKQLEGYLKQYIKEENQEEIQNKQERLSWFCQQEFPFKHPDYWAGFVSQGIS